jgi:hypothetical protein
LRLELRANGFVFTHSRSQIHVKASSVDRQLAKTALEARLGSFVASGHEQRREEQGYQKRPAFCRIDTSRLWEEYQAQRYLHKTLRQAKLASLAVSRAASTLREAVMACLSGGESRRWMWGNWSSGLKIWAFVHSAS